jgi:hypothetical protein
MIRNSYSMARRTHEARREDNVEKMEAQSLSSKKLGHLQKWVKKTEQSEHNNILKGSSILTSSEEYSGYIGNSRVHTRDDL